MDYGEFPSRAESQEEIRISMIVENMHMELSDQVLLLSNSELKEKKIF